MIRNGRYNPGAEGLLAWLAASLLRWRDGHAALASPPPDGLDDKGVFHRRVAVERILARSAAGALGLIAPERVYLAAVDETGADAELIALLEI